MLCWSMWGCFRDGRGAGCGRAGQVERLERPWGRNPGQGPGWIGSSKSLRILTSLSPFFAEGISVYLFFKHLNVSI